MDESKDDVSTQQQGTGEAKTDAQNAADQKATGNADGQQQTGADDKTQSSGAETKGTDTKQPAAGDKKADAGSKDQGSDKSSVPEKYELKLSDGSLLDSKTVDKVAAIARERGLSQEDAQAQLAVIETQTMNDRNERVTEWNESVKADKELGGEHYATTLQSVQRYAGYLKTEYPEVLELLERTGYTSHPAVARFLRDQGNRMAEDKHEQGGGRGKRERPPLEERLYGKTTPKGSESEAA